MLLTGILRVLSTVTHAQQWNGATNLQGMIWRSGNLAVGEQPQRRDDPRAMIEVTRPFSLSNDQDDGLFSANMMYKGHMSPTPCGDGWVIRPLNRRIESWHSSNSINADRFRYPLGRFQTSPTVRLCRYVRAWRSRVGRTYRNPSPRGILIGRECMAPDGPSGSTVPAVNS